MTGPPDDEVALGLAPILSDHRDPAPGEDQLTLHSSPATLCAFDFSAYCSYSSLVLSSVALLSYRVLAAGAHLGDS